MSVRKLTFVLMMFLTIPVTAFSLPLQEAGKAPALSLEECIRAALENNRRRPASRYAVEMAEARHRQALAGYWPQIGLKGGYHRMDEAPNFLFPGRSFSVPEQSLPLPPGLGIAIVDPANNIVGSISSFPGQTIEVPDQDVKLMDEESFVASLEAQWLLYDGGMRKGYREQARGYLEMMKQESRRTDLEIVDSVKRLYYGAVLAGQLHQLGRDTLARMEATLGLTEMMYREGSGTVKKTDYLDNKVMVETLRSMVALLEKNDLMARAALANTMGLPWTASVDPADGDLPFRPVSVRLDELVGTAFRFNPDWAAIEAGLGAVEGALRTAGSGHYPKIAFTGELHKWWNDYDGGMATDENQEGWSVGLGLEIPIFSGFLTQNKVSEEKARLAKIKEERFLLKDGIGLQVRDTFLGLNAAEKSHQATLDAMTAAVENRDLNTRAYQHGLVETEKVIRAQLTEALMSAQHYKALYDHVALQSRLNLIVGSEVMKTLQQ
ncbi:MAG: TolC family protein [Syntrophotaleaceae bacterium]